MSDEVFASGVTHIKAQCWACGTQYCAAPMTCQLGSRGTNLSVEPLAGAAQDGPTCRGSPERDPEQYNVVKSVYWTNPAC